jgi:hypothetical protein
MMYVKLCGLPNSNPKKIIVFSLTLLFTVAGYAAAVISLLDIIGVIDLKSM